MHFPYPFAGALTADGAPSLTVGYTVLFPFNTLFNIFTIAGDFTAVNPGGKKTRWSPLNGLVSKYIELTQILHMVKRFFETHPKVLVSFYSVSYNNKHNTGQCAAFIKQELIACYIENRAFWL